MSIGMTYEQYWYGDSHLAKVYYQAEKYRQEQRDTEAWLIGAYVVKAIEATVGNAFAKGGQPLIEYPEISMLTEKRLNEEAERRKSAEQEENERLFALAWMTNFVNAGKNWGKKKG